MSATLIIVLAVAAVLVLWGIKVQNQLVQSDELCNNALKQINVQQVSRYDALKALVKLTREYATYESETLEKVIAQRKITAAANPSVDDINANEAALQAMSAKLIAIAEQYPDLKANQNYQQVNDTVTKYNNQVRMFPGSVVAGILGFAKRDYLADEPAKKDYPDII